MLSYTVRRKMVSPSQVRYSSLKSVTALGGILK